MIDFRELLIKYMKIVGEAEGVYFIPNSPYYGLTEVDIEALVEISEEIGRRYKSGEYK